MAARMACLTKAGVAAALSIVTCSASAEVVVSNVRAQELADGTKRVEVLYDLAGAPAGGATVSVVFSATGNAPYSITPAAAALSGDVGAGIASGSTKGILLDCGQTLAALGTMGDPASAVVGVDGTRAVHRPYRHLRPRSPDAEITITLPGDVPLVLVRIHGGTPFMMGAPSGEPGSGSSEMPQHQVTINQDYYLGKYLVTQAQWQAVMGTTPSYFSGCGGTCPVEQVSWDDIAGTGGFIDKLNQAQSTTKFRLPTEAEWEYAARGGTTTEFSFSVPAGWDTGCGSFPAAEPYMWWCENSGSTTHPVGQKLANPWGLFDMHGNVWEWVQDSWHSDYTGAPTNGSAWLSPAGSYRVLRGGSWYDYASFCRSAQRYYYPDIRSYSFGFRLARSQ